MANEEKAEEVFVSTPEQIAAAKVAQELVETRIKLDQEKTRSADLAAQVADITRKLKDANGKNDREIVENGVLDSVIDKLIDKLARG